MFNKKKSEFRKWHQKQQRTQLWKVYIFSTGASTL